ncbi:MAG: hypothetical protein GOU97_02625 [Nanoarchaeota archaeon]|nr:hypothetical protein [Nanoarchaeota archaeon]
MILFGDKLKKRINKLKKFYYKGFTSELEMVYTSAELYLEGNETFAEETKKVVENIKVFYERIKEKDLSKDESLKCLSVVKKNLPEFIEQFELIINNKLDNSDRIKELYEEMCEVAEEFGVNFKKLAEQYFNKKRERVIIIDKEGKKHNYPSEKNEKKE